MVTFLLCSYLDFPPVSVLISSPYKVTSFLGLGSIPWTSFYLEVKSLSCVRFFATPWTVAYQAPLSTEFSRQEYWSGFPFPSPGDLPNPGIKPRSTALRQPLYHLSHQVHPFKDPISKYSHILRCWESGLQHEIWGRHSSVPDSNLLTVMSQVPDSFPRGSRGSYLYLSVHPFWEPTMYQALCQLPVVQSWHV